jgi:hypothetical protein
MNRRSVVSIIPATAAHIEAIVGHLHPDHVVELADRGLTDRAALELCMKHSVMAWTAFDGPVALAMWGCAAPLLLGDSAWPWIIATAALARHRVRFWREVKRHIPAMLRLYPILTNDFHVRDGEACRMLLRLGFVRTVTVGDFSTFELRA